MKAKTVNETINFQRGQTPKESVRIGKSRNYVITKALIEGMWPQTKTLSTPSTIKLC
jgi:hypothetical protein